MNGVIGMTGLLLDTALTTEQLQFAKLIQSSADALLSVINDILDFSKIEAGKLAIEVIDFNLKVLFQEFSATMEANCRGRKLAFSSAVSPEIPSLLQGDPGRLRQILINLVGNAVKFTRVGEINVMGYLAKETDSEVVVRFTVRDTGIGIPADKLGLLFSRFTQVDASSTRKFGGTGLGLAISKQLAQMMGEEIGVSSKQGRVSEFWFSARFQKQNVISNSKSQVVARPGLSDPIRSSRRILLAEDNITNQQVALGILHKLGLKADAVANGREVLVALRHIPYDLVLMDVQRPEMDGLEATREIRSGQCEGVNPKLPIVAMTARAMTGDKQACLDAGMNDYIAKPVSAEIISPVLERWLANAKQGRRLLPEPPNVDRAPDSPGADSDPPVFVESVLVNRLGGGRALTKNIASAFLADIPKRIEMLLGHLNAGDANEVTREAHSIRGASATVGGEALRVLAFRIEQSGRSGDLNAVRAIAAGLRQRS
jgi:CheY-like chemotaxis protein/HPt (histidine-containing phosphotransfer) domain-containing protein